MIKKLKQQKGETLIEVMVSLLIAVLSIGLLSSAMLAAANLNKKNREADEKFAADLQRAESLTSETGYEAVEAKVIIDFANADYDDVDVKVKLYGGETGSFAAYEQAEVSPE